jgi:hypothetical protein
MKAWRLTIFRPAASVTEVRRVKKLPLQLSDDLMHDTGTDDVAAGERMCNGLQKRIAQLERQRPRSGHDGAQFVIG